MRCFISIDLPKEIIEKIKKIQEELPKFIGKKTETENLHLTLKFLGDIDEEKINMVKDKLKKIKIAKFETEINGIGVFSEKVIRIIWLHLTNCDRLQKEIDSSLKNLFNPEQRFMSHLTIARVKKIKNKGSEQTQASFLKNQERKKFLEKLKRIKIPKIKFVVDNFKLKSSVLKSEGPVYGDIEKYKLE